MLNKPKYILFILSIAFSAVTLANVVLFYYHIEDQLVFVLTTIATCSFSTVSMTYLFFHFKQNYIDKKVMEDEHGELDVTKMKAEVERIQRERELEQRQKQFEENIGQKKGTPGYSEFLTKTLAKDLDLCQAAYFGVVERNNREVLKLQASFAYHIPESQEVIFEFGEGLSGQAAIEGKLVNIKKVPEGYISVFSGLGKATPSNLVILPFKSNGKVTGVLELASFKEFDAEDEKFLGFISEIA